MKLSQALKKQVRPQPSTLLCRESNSGFESRGKTYKCEKQCKPRFFPLQGEYVRRRHPVWRGLKSEEPWPRQAG